MKLSSTILRYFLVFLLGGLIASPSYAYESFTDLNAAAGETRITIDEGEFSYSIRKGLQLIESDFGGYGGSYLCPTFTAERPECDVTRDQMQFSSFGLLPLCENSKSENCVEAAAMSIGSDAPKAGNFLGYAPGFTYSAVAETGLHEAGTASLFDFPDLPNAAGSTTYAVMVYERQNYDPRLKRFWTDTMNFVVVPYTIETGNYSAVTINEFVDGNGNNQVGERGPGGACVFSDVNLCAKRQAFSPETNIELTVRYSKDINGWFRGRLTKPSLAVEDFSASNYRVTVQGQPVDVPRFAVIATPENTPDNIKKMFQVGSGGSGELWQAGSGKGAFATDGWNNRPYQIIEAFRGTVQDKAAAISSVWNLESFSLNGRQSCFSMAKGLIGLVTTNATVYEGTEPSYSGGTLGYKVAGLHYSPSGGLNLGTYDLVMRSETARCLYGFSNAPLSATVSVIGENGQDAVATTIVSEKDGWLKLAAYGFTFSEKEIKVKLTQPYAKTLTKFSGTSKALTPKQKAEIKVAVTKAKGNPKFICTGTYLEASSRATALARAKATCNYAKSLDKNHSYLSEAKQTKAKTYDAKVIISSK